LVLYIIGSEKVLQSGRCLGVESLKFWFETFGSEFLMDVIIIIDSFRGGPRFYWDDLNVVAVINVADHNVRVALAGSHREFSRQVCIKLTLIDQDDINQMGCCAQICISCWILVNWCLRGGPNVLASLIHVPHSRCRREFQMFVDCFFC
jgi:hypothetical protein